MPAPIGPATEWTAQQLLAALGGSVPNKPVGVATEFTLQAILASLQAGGGDKNFVYNQLSSSATWTINHGLTKYPAVTIVDSAGTVVIGTVDYPSLNQVVVTFTTPFAGKAYLN